MVLPLQDTKPSHVYLGVLNCLRQIIPHLEDSFSKSDSFKGSFGSQRSLSINGNIEQKEVNLKQLLQVKTTGDLIYSPLHSFICSLLPIHNLFIC